MQGLESRRFRGSGCFLGLLEILSNLAVGIPLGHRYAKRGGLAPDAVTVTKPRNSEYLQLNFPIGLQLSPQGQRRSADAPRKLRGSGNQDLPFMILWCRSRHNGYDSLLYALSDAQRDRSQRLVPQPFAC
jgi:hypothetical protein